MGFLPWWMKLHWRKPRVLYVLCAIEFPFTVATLALFGIASPNTYRTDLWTEGSRHGWNSDPIDILYSFANYRPVEVPVPWNQFLTNFNVAICVCSMFILLAKTVMFITQTLPPIFSAVLHAALAALYAYSISMQTAADNLDPTHPSKHPWYLTRGCGAPADPALKGYCEQARASLAVSAIMLALFCVHIIVAIAYAFPSKAQKEAAAEQKAADDWLNDTNYEKYQYEMDRVSQAPNSPSFPPMTPRTQAFNTLDGTLAAKRQTNKDLPLRHHISMGDETYKSGVQYA